MKKSIFSIISNEPLTSSVYKMTLRGDCSHITHAGQFVNISLDGMYLRRPISVCDVEGDGGAMRYALISDKNGFVLYGDDRFFEFSVSLDSALDVSNICFAMDYCGLSVHKMQSLPNTLENAVFCRFEILERTTALTCWSAI